MLSKDRDTRDRLIGAAARLFAARGFKRVTVRDICREGRANLAAVNYHFGDKLGLYREVLQTAAASMRSTLDTAKAAGHGGGAEEKIRAYVRVYLERVAGATNEAWIHRLISRELVDPTPALDVIVQEAVRPRLAYLSTLVADVLARAVDDERVVMCAQSIHAQCLLVHPVAARLYPDVKITPTAIVALADHIASFSLAGIRAARPRSRASATYRTRRRVSLT